jgi:hypothetical protein
VLFYLLDRVPAQSSASNCQLSHGHRMGCRLQRCYTSMPSYCLVSRTARRSVDWHASLSEHFELGHVEYYRAYRIPIAHVARTRLECALLIWLCLALGPAASYGTPAKTPVRATVRRIRQAHQKKRKILAQFTQHTNEALSNKAASRYDAILVHDLNTSFNQRSISVRGI